MKKQTKTVENNNEKKTCRFGKLSRRLQVLLGVLIALLVLLVGLAWSRLQLYQQLYAPSQPVEHPTPTSTPRPIFTPTPTPFRMSPGRLSYILDDAYKLKPIFFHILARVDSSDNNRERTTINHYYTDRQLGCALSVTFRKLPQEYLSFLVKIGTLSSIKDLNDSTEDLSSQFSNEVYILSNEAPYPDPFSEEARLLPVMQQFGQELPYPDKLNNSSPPEWIEFLRSQAENQYPMIILRGIDGTYTVFIRFDYLYKPGC